MNEGRIAGSTAYKVTRLTSEQQEHLAALETINAKDIDELLRVNTSQLVDELGAVAPDGRTVAAHLSDRMVEQSQGQPAAAEYLAETEHDAEEQWRFDPILKRKKKGQAAEVIAQQGLLF